ncbi:MAG: flagellar hook-basal body complex protein, partial [Bythopirellula sp.]
VLGTNEIEAPIETFAATDLLVTDFPDPATAAETGAGTGPDAGLVRYRLGFLDANGFESTFSAEFNVTNSAPGSIDLSSIDLADGTTFVDRVIYRTTADGSTFYRVGNIGNNVDTTFTDNVDDATLITNQQLDDSFVDEGSYNYYFTFYNPSTSVETRPTSRIPSPSVSDPAGGRIRIDLDQIAAPTDSGFQQIRIYRNLSGQSSNFRRVAEVPSQASGSYVSTYIDTTPSSALSGSGELNLDGPPAGNGTLLNDVFVREGEVFTRPLEVGELSFSGVKNGVQLSEQSLAVTATSTVQDLLDFIRDATGLDQQSSVAFPEPTADVSIANGQIVVTSNMGEQNAIDIPLTGFSLVPDGETIGNTIALNFNATQKAVGPGTSSEFIAYDSLGLPINVRITTVLESRDSNSTTYRWYATSADNEPLNGTSTVVGDGILTFDGNGDLDDDNPTARISVARNDTASVSPLEIELNFSSVKALGEVDAQQNPISTLNVTNQDGFPPGVLTDFIVTNDGVIQGQFSNGTQRTVGQLVMARFANNGGLQQVGDSMFNVGVNSGDPTFGVPGAEGIGTLSAGAVELSNTDIGQNLIELILASTQYRGGARVITATQELLDELLALSR